jgi:hypothetical protein
MFCFGEALDDAAIYAKLFGCGIRMFPITYLDILIYYQRLTNAKWKLVKEKVTKMIKQLRKLLSLGGRLVFINSVLSNMVLHIIYFFQQPKEYCIDWIICN